MDDVNKKKTAKKQNVNDKKKTKKKLCIITKLKYAIFSHVNMEFYML